MQGLVRCLRDGPRPGDAIKARWRSFAVDPPRVDLGGAAHIGMKGRRHRGPSTEGYRRPDGRARRNGWDRFASLSGML